MKDKFLEITKEVIKRDGINELVKWLEETDFFDAPASTRFHGNYRGGLVEHSINVYNQLLKLNSIYNLTESKETLAIVSLFHDLTKIGCYKESFKNVKNEAGVWEKVPCYTFDEKFAFGGHGSKSVYLIQKYMQLTDEEAVCINNHMGAFDKPSGDYSVSNAFEMFPLALLVHTADMLATCIDENKNNPPQEESIEDLVKQILDLCKNIIDKGTNKEEVYSIISAQNNGKKNPNSIKDIEIAKTIIKQLKEKL